MGSAAYKYTIGVLEDDANTREYLVAAIEEHEALSVVAQWDSLGQARDWFKSGRACSAMLLDIGLPDGNGISLIPEIRKCQPSPEVMVITIFSDPVHIMGAIDAGVSGYLLKDADPETVRKSVLSLLAGGSPISPSIARYLLNRIQGSDDETVASLTEREREVLVLVSKGLTSGEVASALQISYHTVTTHVRNIYKKLSVTTRGEAVYEAQRLGIISISKQ